MHAVIHHLLFSLSIRPKTVNHFAHHLMVFTVTTSTVNN